MAGSIRTPHVCGCLGYLYGIGVVGSGKVSDLDQHSTDGHITLKPCFSPSVLGQIQVGTGVYQHMTRYMSGVVLSCMGRMSISPCIQV